MCAANYCTNAGILDNFVVCCKTSCFIMKRYFIQTYVYFQISMPIIGAVTLIIEFKNIHIEEIPDF